MRKVAYSLPKKKEATVQGGCNLKNKPAREVLHTLLQIERMSTYHVTFLLNYSFALLNAESND
jgi:hypothetical protein